MRRRYSGSETSSAPSALPFLQAVSPAWAVVPAGNSHGHPHAPTLQRLRDVISPDSDILRTDAGPAPTDPSGDDNLIFVVNASGITEILRVRVD